MLGGQQQLDQLWLSLEGPLHEVCIGGLRLEEPGEVCLQIIDWHAIWNFEGSSVQLQSNIRAVVRSTNCRLSSYQMGDTA